MFTEFVHWPKQGGYSFLSLDNFVFIVAELLDGHEGTPMTRELTDRDGDENLLHGLIAPEVSTHV